VGASQSWCALGSEENVLYWGRSRYSASCEIGTRDKVAKGVVVPTDGDRGDPRAFSFLRIFCCLDPLTPVLGLISRAIAHLGILIYYIFSTARDAALLFVFSRSPRRHTPCSLLFLFLSQLPLSDSCSCLCAWCACVCGVASCELFPPAPTHATLAEWPVRGRVSCMGRGAGEPCVLCHVGYEISMLPLLPLPSQISISIVYLDAPPFGLSTQDTRRCTHVECGGALHIALGCA
jgi:hypothetical protein